MMDMRLVLTGVYSSGTGLTTFTAPCPYFPAIAVQLSTGVAHTLTLTGDTTSTAVGDLSSGSCVLGTYAPFDVDLSEVIARDGQDKPEVDLGVLLKSVTLLHQSAGGFSVTVAHSRSDLWSTETYSFAPDLTAAAETVLS